MFFLTHVSKKDGKMRVHNKNEKYDVLHNQILDEVVIAQKVSKLY